MTYTKPDQRKKEQSEEERGTRSSLLILDLKEGNFKDLGKEEGKMFQELHMAICVKEFVDEHFQFTLSCSARKLLFII